MDDVYASQEFRSIHTLQRCLGTSRFAEEHPYEAVTSGLKSLRADRRGRRLTRRVRRARA